MKSTKTVILLFVCITPIIILLTAKWRQSNTIRLERDRRLLQAVVAGDRHAVMVLLDQGANPNTTSQTYWYDAPWWSMDESPALDEGDPVLSIAARCGPIDIVKALLDRCARVNAANKYGETALHAAVDANQAEIVKVLLQAGADVNVRDIDVTPLEMAKSKGETSILKLLTQAGARE